MIGDKTIIYKRKAYELVSVRDAKHFSQLEHIRKQAQKYIGKDGKVLRIRNTYMFGLYKPLDYIIRLVKLSGNEVLFEREKTLYWNNNNGWVDRDSATIFSEQLRDTVNLPIGGIWVRK